MREQIGRVDVWKRREGENGMLALRLQHCARGVHAQANRTGGCVEKEGGREGHAGAEAAALCSRGACASK
eukprot:359394-Chlamydomonas_euryale.AAC.1